MDAENGCTSANEIAPTFCSQYNVLDRRAPMRPRSGRCGCTAFRHRIMANKQSHSALQHEQLPNLEPCDEKR